MRKSCRLPLINGQSELNRTEIRATLSTASCDCCDKTKRQTTPVLLKLHAVGAAQVSLGAVAMRSGMELNVFITFCNPGKPTNRKRKSKDDNDQSGVHCAVHFNVFDLLIS
ncbi:RNA polymerase II-associated factor 1-like protein [Frankliniella fusca]|uniref:RNA polymerase II-associated factor 1-like protein n=1 Tax=Frankliniella fusca TaxID=407009 RepID=A0AAE1L773_9NEOP|nr:RNA polymerase II-associated factor 1-like protein [Frankliniella fusca]